VILSIEKNRSGVDKVAMWKSVRWGAHRPFGQTWLNR
jgi:hypothetical protein